MPFESNRVKASRDGKRSPMHMNTLKARTTLGAMLALQGRKGRRERGKRIGGYLELLVSQSLYQTQNDTVTSQRYSVRV